MTFVLHRNKNMPDEIFSARCAELHSVAARPATIFHAWSPRADYVFRISAEQIRFQRPSFPLTRLCCDHRILLWQQLSLWCHWDSSMLKDGLPKLAESQASDANQLYTGRVAVAEPSQTRHFVPKRNKRII